MKFYTSDCSFGKTSKGQIFAAIWIGVFKEFLKEFTFLGLQVELDFLIEQAIDNIEIRWSGYNDSMREFVTRTFDKIVQMKT